jgi:hypothetical protein
MKLKDYIYFEVFIFNFFRYISIVSYFLYCICIFINFGLVFLFLNCDKQRFMALYFDIEFCICVFDTLQPVVAAGILD